MGDIKMLADAKYLEGFAQGYSKCEENLYKSYKVSGMPELVQNIRKEMLEELKLFTKMNFCAFTSDRTLVFECDGEWKDLFKEFGL